MLKSFGYSWRATLTALTIGGIAACADGGGGAGCGGCGATGEGPAYEYPAEGPIIPQAAQIHVTETALTFIEENAAGIIGDLAGGGGGGLSFCVPTTDIPVVGSICGGSSRCDDGSAGCQAQIVLEDVQATPFSETPSDRLEVRVSISLGAPLAARILFSNCGITIDPPVPVAANVFFEVEPALTGRTAIRLPADRLEIDTSAILDSLQIDGGLGCTITGGALNLLGGFLGGLIEGALIGPIQGAIDPLLCQTCATTTCPFGSTCNGDGLCIEDGAEQCVPIELGVQTEINVGDLLADFAPGLDARLGLLAYAANYADANGPTVTPQYGLDLAAEVGFYSEPNACVPFQDVPSVSRVPKSAQLNTATTPSGAEFAVGIGVAESALELALWGAFRSGALCLAIGSEVSELVSTGTFAAFLPSLAQLVGGENRPLSLVLRPQIAPTITLGAGTILPNPSGPPTIVDPLLTIELRQVEIDFYTILEDRWVRTFTLDTDIEVPLALTVNAANELEVLIGDLAEAITRVEAVNGELLAASEIDNIASVLPGLIGGLLPTLLGDGGLIPPIAIPDLQGFRLILPDDAFTSIEANTMLAIFANIEFVGAGTGELVGSLQPIIRSTSVTWEQGDPASLLSAARFERTPVDVRALTPTVRVALQTDTFNVDSPGVEYAYRVGQGLWSLWHRGETLEIRDPRFALQGRHDIEIRVRELGDPYTTSVQTVSTTVVIDYQSPSVRLDQEGTTVFVDARDTVAYTSEMAMRYRLNEGAWSEWSDVYDAISLEAFTGRVFVEAEVRDSAGNVTRAREAFHTVGQPLVSTETLAPTLPLAGGDANQNGAQAGCSATGNSDSTSGALGLLLIGGLALLTRRRRNGGAISYLALAAGIVVAACGDDRAVDSIIDQIDGSSDGSANAGCEPACSANQQCVDGICIGCGSDEDCEAGFVCEAGTCIVDDTCLVDQDCPDGQRCLDGACTQVECITDADCTCEQFEIPTCVNDVCQCGPPCADGCGEGEACCLPNDACVPVSATCDNKECGPGFTVEPTSEVSFDPEACTATLDCDCVELPPLAPGNIGRYLDVVTDDDTNYLAAYNSTYGDLMFGVAAEDDTIAWTHVLGVPETGTVTGSVDGPRGGRSAAGPDVGLYPSIGASSEGRLWMAYRYEDGDEALVGLNFAISTAAPELAWSHFVLDSDPGAGLWTELLADPSGLPVVIYGVPVQDADSRTNATEIRIRRATAIHPTSADDFSDAFVLDTVVSTLACGGRCSSRELCRLDLNVCARSERASACDPGCAEGQECFENADGANACAAVEPPPALSYFPTGGAGFIDAAIGADGQLYVASYDGAAGNLRLATHTLGTDVATSVIVDGEEATAEGVVDTGDVGLFPDVLVQADNSVLITYADATLHRLLAWNSTTNVVDTVDNGYRCFEFDAAISQCRRLLTARVGGDSQLISRDGVISVLVQDQTQHDIISRTLRATGWDAIYQDIAGAEATYDGAFGFYNVFGRDSRGEFVATYRLQNRSEPAERTVRIVRLP